MTRIVTTSVLLLGLSFSLAACGHTTGSRALSGGAIGAGAGAIVGGATGLGAGTGALIGGAGGAGAGALTTPNQVNLGHAP
jgi:osmotically inducible lipoprotein OsmB